ncbi:N-acetylneuraminate synthase [Catenovulum sp. SM1970]|uniref:N-acetylneuraminate synthase n=1 Tax=Marinifaba aquimaris TaxID=2741323 RepID=UPI0015729256|nr:N-acetylneuraminate synthase [Marinifaba aquimaris]NTS75364.1 N-acetylneuraminate synthase [Marinifaba aquimaris]
MKGNKTFIIAEAGVNHNGSFELAKQLIDVAVIAGADAVKFQTFKAELLATSNAKQANYQAENTGLEESQLKMLKRLELTHHEYAGLRDYCIEKNIEFMSTAFEEQSLNYVINDLAVSRLKVGSGEITNGPLLIKHARSMKPIILSTGMSDMKTIEDALAVLAFGYLTKEGMPGSLDECKHYYQSDSGRDVLLKKVSLLHCTSQYPAPLEDINLNAMVTMREHFGLAVGYSDHSQGTVVSLAAVSAGASIIEKHFTLDRNLPGPDHKASLTPKELKQLVDGIRCVEISQGRFEKLPSEDEIEVAKVARKSLIAEENIAAGELFTEQNVSIKRPGVGMSPMMYWSLIGKQSKHAYNKGELLDE